MKHTQSSCQICMLNKKNIIDACALMRDGCSNGYLTEFFAKKKLVQLFEKKLCKLENSY